MAKDLSEIKLSVGNNLKLNLEDKKIGKLLIAGNTINFFGFVKDGNLDFMSMGEEDRKRYLWLLKRAIEKTEIYVIGEIEEKEHYIELFDIMGQQGVRVNWKYIETFVPKDYLKIAEKIKNMKFDVCIMNPPYDRSLHLKFLERVIQISDSVVSIQPIRWLTDILGSRKKTSDFKRYENSISKHISDLCVIDDKMATSLFGAGFNFDLGIYYCDCNGGYDYKRFQNNNIFDKVLKHTPHVLNDVINYSIPENAIITNAMTGGKNVKSLILDLYPDDNYSKYVYDKNGKCLQTGLTYLEYRKTVAWGNVGVKAEILNIKFDTTEECKNFFDYTKSYLFRYIFHVITNDINVQFKFLPFLDDYTHSWSDEDLYKYFDITKEEQREIGTVVDEVLERVKQFKIEIANKKKRKRKSN